MRNFLRLTFLLCLFGLANSVLAGAQQKMIKGSVKDETGQPLIGVTIQVKGTSMGTVTDAKGNFSIDVPAGDSTLTFSYVGYTTLCRCQF